MKQGYVNNKWLMRGVRAHFLPYSQIPCPTLRMSAGDAWPSAAMNRGTTASWGGGAPVSEISSTTSFQTVRLWRTSVHHEHSFLTTSCILPPSNVSPFPGTSIWFQTPSGGRSSPLADRRSQLLKTNEEQGACYTSSCILTLRLLPIANTMGHPFITWQHIVCKPPPWSKFTQKSFIICHLIFSGFAASSS